MTFLMLLGVVAAVIGVAMFLRLKRKPTTLPRDLADTTGAKPVASSW